MAQKRPILMICCDSRNVRSQKVAERLGYVREGCLRHEILDTDGRPADLIVYSMIPDDYARATWR